MNGFNVWVALVGFCALGAVGCAAEESQGEEPVTYRNACGGADVLLRDASGNLELPNGAVVLASKVTEGGRSASSLTCSGTSNEAGLHLASQGASRSECFVAHEFSVREGAYVDQLIVACGTEVSVYVAE